MLCVTAFVLTAAPRVRLMLGPIPVYLVDICTVLTLYHALQCRPRAFNKTRHLATAVLVLAFFVVLAQIGNAITGGWFLMPAYMLIRYMLAISLFFSMRRLVPSLSDMMVLIKPLTLGLAVTALLIVVVSLPPTRWLATTYVFNNPLLEPIAESRTVGFGDTNKAARGRSLVGVSTLSGGFIGTLWPFALLLVTLPQTTAGWKQIGRFAAVVAPFGSVMTYARGAVLGLGLIILTFSSLAKGKSRGYVIAIVVLAVGVFHLIGWDSELFFFGRYKKRFAMAVDAPFEGVSERERALSYTEPFAHVAENPQFLFVGEGNSGGRRAPVARVRHSGDKATHSSFSWSYYGFGMTAAFCNVFIFVYAVSTMFKAVRSAGNLLAPRGMMAICLLASLMGMLPWWLFGHATMSIPRGMMLYMLVLGLVAAFIELRRNSTTRSRPAVVRQMRGIAR